MSNAAAPWVFDFRPDPGDDAPLPERVAAAVADAERRGLRVGRVRIEVTPEPVEGASPPVIRVRRFLKHAKRHTGLLARWPDPVEVR
jgi:hypothetical protein